MTDQYLTVSALTRYIKRKFELDQHLTTVWLRAEISNFKHHNRGHMYFTLKDDQARIMAVMFNGYNRALNFQPENGMDVIVKGQVSVYEAQGQYQLYVHEMIPDGVGALHVAYEQLKANLEREGLFSETRKLPIVKFPKRIAIVTAKTGAAVRDIISTIMRRYPIVDVTVYQTLVQGNDAKFEIVDRLKQINQEASADTIILGRGGGSIEELWAFNEEMVARTIAESSIPIITGIGHETDFTIADFVSDLRAPTPTAAAELAVPSLVEVTRELKQLTGKLDEQLMQRLKDKKYQLERLTSSYAFKYPKQLINEKEQELDRMVDRLQKASLRQAVEKRQAFDYLVKRIETVDLKHLVKQEQVKIDQRKKQIETNFYQQYQRHLQRFQTQLNKLELLSPLKIMQRGYSLSYDKNKQLVKSVKQIVPGDSLTLRLRDGDLDCQVWGIEEKDNVTGGKKNGERKEF
ncbi:exodeoxyribonuclease VII large subunit [Streptohalobacillus salinus]|uniref:Exodeoxyribonuclease 7 large subunit n=1 Tax=Streptohalobacillus salinus TaxID=621096 RepID=A0A2V3WC74_9BACI|nr:exodeoxyribonuclease VII large subunit [Streptohalobacillus salinus]PXW91672.1 exodeoxyribonuclease VII large subunit [Streptohalobacillus salinus]